MGNLGKWSFMVGVVLAIAAGFFTIKYILTILAVLGLIVGVMNVAQKRSQEYLVAVIALMIVGVALLQAFSAINSLYGVYESILTNFVVFVGASGLVVAFKEVMLLGRGDE